MASVSYWYLDDKATMTHMVVVETDEVIPKKSVVSTNYDLTVPHSQEVSDMLCEAVMKLPTTKGHPTMYLRTMRLLVKSMVGNNEDELAILPSEAPLMPQEMRPFLTLLQRLVRDSTEPA